jgi:hypothetical protein
VKLLKLSEIFNTPAIKNIELEIHVEHDYNTYGNKEYGDDLDWTKCDYFDK